MNLNVSTLAPYAKAVVAVLGAVLLAAKALTDGLVSADELQAVGVAAATAFAVFRVPNKG